MNAQDKINALTAALALVGLMAAVALGACVALAVRARQWRDYAATLSARIDELKATRSPRQQDRQDRIASHLHLHHLVPPPGARSQAPH